MLNNISWPRNYHPVSHVIKKNPPKFTKEEILQKELKIKHHVPMDVCLDYQVESIIQDLGYLAQTKNAFKTYKESGWKSTFMKYRNEALEIEKS